MNHCFKHGIFVVCIYNATMNKEYNGKALYI